MPNFWTRAALRYRNFMQAELRADFLDALTAARRETQTLFCSLTQNLTEIREALTTVQIQLSALHEQAEAHRTGAREEFFAQRNGAHEEFLAQQKHFANQHLEFQRLHEQREKLATAMARLGDFERTANALESALLTIALHNQP